MQSAHRSVNSHAGTTVAPRGEGGGGAVAGAWKLRWRQLALEQTQRGPTSGSGDLGWRQRLFFSFLFFSSRSED